MVQRGIKKMFEMVLAFIILLSAFLAIYHKEVIYSIISMTVVFLAISALYFYLGAVYSAIFQLATGLGTSITFLIMGRTLSPIKPTDSTLKKTILGFIAVLILLIPVLMEVGQPEIRILPMVSTVSIALWNVRILDVFAQSLVVLTMAIGIGIVLAEEGDE